MKKEYSVKNMHCAACKNNVESALKKVGGVKTCEVNLITNSAKIEFDEKTIQDEEVLFKAVENIGYELVDDFDEEEVFNTKKDHKKLIKIIVGFILLIPLIFVGMGGMYPHLFSDYFKENLWISATIQFVLAFTIIGMFFSYYKNGFLSIIKLKFNMDSLVFLGSFFSVIYSIYLFINSFFTHYPFEHFHLYLDGAAMILVIVSLGKLIEEMSINKAKSTIKELLDLRPKEAHKVDGDNIVTIPSKAIRLNDVLLVKPGETIPSDGVVLSGQSSVDESIISGESLPIFKKEDDYVIGGSVNKEAPLKILVNKTKKDNVLSKIATLVSEASNMKTPLTKRVDKVASIFTPTVIIIAIIVFISWMIAGYINGGVIIQNMHFTSIFDEAFVFGVGVLVISCPCALGLATPISLLVGSSVFSKNYVLVQKSEAIEKVKDIDCLVLDKTNTITEGELAVVSTDILKPTILMKQRVFTAESYSEHPIAKALVNELKEEVSSLSSDFLMNETLPGAGLKSYFKDETIYITNLKYIVEELKINIDESLLFKINEHNKVGELVIVIYSETHKEILGIYYLKDKLKKESVEFIKEAKKVFKRIILLTGDNKIIASHIANEVGINEVISEVKPEDKDKEIEKLQKEGYKVMMVGDGVNDSIALTRSDVGVAVAKGSDIALASADFILMRSSLNDIFKILNISRRIRNNISFNLFWAFLYNAIFIPVAAGCFAPLGFILEPMYCSMLMALSSVTVCLNALSLFIKKN